MIVTPKPNSVRKFVENVSDDIPALMNRGKSVRSNGAAADDVGPVMGVADTAVGYVSTANNALGLASLGLLVSQAAGGLVYYAGRPFTLLNATKPIANGFEKVGSKIGALNRWVTNKDIADVKIPGVSKAVGGVAQGMANGAAAVMETGAMKSGAQRVADYYANSSARAFEKAQGLATKHPGLYDQLMGKGVAEMALVPQEQLQEQLGKAAQGAREALKDKSWWERIKGGREIGKVEKLVGKATEHHQAAQGWSNPGQTMRELPAKMGKAKLGHALFAGTAVVGSGVQTYGTVRSLGKDLYAFKEMIAAHEGKKVEDISTTRALFGSVPEELKATRSTLRNEFGPRMLMSVGNLAINVKWLKGGNFSMLPFFGLQMAEKAVGNIFDGSALQLHQDIKNKHKNGMPAEARDYAGYLVQAVPALKARGEKGAFLGALAAQYAQEQVEPEVIIAEMKSGKLMGRVDALQKEYAAKQHAAHAPEKTHSHVEVLKGAHKDRPAMGAHTAKVAESVHEGHVRGHV